jgi:hypothetical protein
MLHPAISNLPPTKKQQRSAGLRRCVFNSKARPFAAGTGWYRRFALLRNAGFRFRSQPAKCTCGMCRLKSLPNRCLCLLLCLLCITYNKPIRAGRWPQVLRSPRVSDASSHPRRCMVLYLYSATRSATIHRTDTGVLTDADFSKVVLVLARSPCSP